MTESRTRTDLNFGLSAETGDLSEKKSPQARREASDADRQAFERARAAPAAEAETQPDLPNPFALFSDTARAGLARTAGSQDLARQLSDVADRLLAGDDKSDRREVRTDLKGEILQGVSMPVNEEADELEQAPAGPVVVTAAPSDPPTPFAFFSDSVRSAESSTDAQQILVRHLASVADRLLVGDGSSGRREVRIDLKAEVLPGVTMSVYEEGAWLVVEFSCAQESSRDTLCRCAQQLADELVASLRRSTVLRVHTNDPDDPRPFEAAGVAG